MIFIYRIYTVGINDTLQSISSTLGIKEDDLRKINGFSNIHQIKEGDQIIIPAGNNNFTTYTIEKGDNLYELAQKYNTSAKQLQLLNGLDEDEYIYPGETIIVPATSTKFYITEEGDTLNKVYEILGIPNQLANQNIYVLPNQLIVHKN